MVNKGGAGTSPRRSRRPEAGKDVQQVGREGAPFRDAGAGRPGSAGNPGDGGLGS